MIQPLVQRAALGTIFIMGSVTALVQQQPLFLEQSVLPVEAIVMFACPQVFAQHVVQGIIFTMEFAILLVL